MNCGNIQVVVLNKITQDHIINILKRNHQRNAFSGTQLQ